GDFDANGHDDMLWLVDGELRMLLTAEPTMNDFAPLRFRAATPEGLGKDLGLDSARIGRIEVGTFDTAAGDDLLVVYDILDGNDAVGIFGGPGLDVFEDPIISFEDPIIS